MLLAAGTIFSWSALADAWTRLEDWVEGAEETLVVFPTYAALEENGDLIVPLRAWVFEPEEESTSRNLLVDALSASFDIETDTQRERFRKRIWPFLADNERGKSIAMTLGDTSFQLGETAPNGHVRKRIRIPAELAADTLKVEPGRRWLEPTFETEFGSRRVVIPVVEPSGLTVVSDIDDTIKQTEVLDRSAMLKNTFLEEFRPVDGMAELYDQLATRDGAAFHYLSASPWQLLPFLESFAADHGFPKGIFHLRQLRPKSLSSPADFVSGSSDYKTATLERLITDFPKREFLLIGDSGEHDPEVFGTIARKHPDAVRGILIRRVAGADNGDDRFAEAFRDLSDDEWRVIDPPVDSLPAFLQ